jgi:4-hydroxy-tetrahydrodipicolinate synthase
MDYSRFEGLFIPTVTPFNPDYSLDLASYDRLTRYQAAMDGVAGLSSCARIGEGTVLRLEEKYEVYRVAGEAAHAFGKRHIATILPQSTAEAIEIIRRLETLPVDAVMIFPPLLFAWGKVSGDLKFRFFEDIQKATKLPVVLFQIPVQSYWYDPETITRIAGLPNVVAYKDASFNVELYTETCRQLKAAGRKMRVLTGNDHFVGKSYELGAVGALIGVSNVATELWAALDRAGRSGDFARALELQQELKKVSNFIFAEPIVEAVARLKAVLQEEGLIAHATVRPPQMGISAAEKEAVLRSYRELHAEAQ